MKCVLVNVINELVFDLMFREKYLKMFELIIVMLSITALSIATDCEPSITTASGWAAPIKICSGQLIFEENFDTLNKNKWKPEVTFRLVAGVRTISFQPIINVNCFSLFLM